MLSFIFGAFNRLLPFATPGTPLAQDLIHLLAVCTLLYFAPQIQDFFTPHPPVDVPSEQTVPSAPDPPPAPAAEQEPNPLPETPTFGEEATQIDEPAPPPPAQEANDPQAGPADGPRAGPSRPVGAKKAASLARRDQRRAYNEFLRSQGEAARARDAEGAAEREAAAVAEKVRRDAVEAELRERERREREERRAAEERDRVAELRLREETEGRVRRALRESGACDLRRLAGDVGRAVEWVEGLVRAGGLLRGEQGEVVFVTEEKWVVRVAGADMDECWRLLAASGRERVGYEEVSMVLEGVVRARGIGVGS